MEKNSKGERARDAGPPTYMVPASIGLALGSVRGTLMSLAIAQVKSKELILDVDNICEILRMLGDFIDESRVQRDKIEDLEARISDAKYVLDNSKALFLDVGKALDGEDE